MSGGTRNNNVGVGYPDIEEIRLLLSRNNQFSLKFIGQNGFSTDEKVNKHLGDFCSELSRNFQIKCSPLHFQGFAIYFISLIFSSLEFQLLFSPTQPQDDVPMQDEDEIRNLKDLSDVYIFDFCKFDYTLS